VTSGAGGVRVRASPLFLARWSGGLAEVYVADDERVFDDGAWFATQRVYRRDLLTGDSTLVFTDPAVPRLAARHATRHPESHLLDPEERAEAPVTSDEENAPGASAAVALAGAHGPYLSLDLHTQVSIDPTEAGDDASTDADLLPDMRRRRVVDLRSGREVTLADLFGAEAAGHLAAAGRHALDSAVTALRPAASRAVRAAQAAGTPSAPDADAPRRALAALRVLQLDPGNFGLAAHGGRPAVAFVATGRDDDGTTVTLALPPVTVPGSVPEWWRRDVEPALFVGPGADGAAGLARWRDASGRYEVRARVADGGAVLELAPGAPVVATTGAAVAAAGPHARPAAGTAGAKTPAARRVLPLGRVPAPLLQVIRVDAGAVDPAARRALRRAFDESAFYDDATISVAWRPGRTPGRPVTGRRARPGAPS
jgi:hypothetical protein